MSLELTSLVWNDRNPRDPILKLCLLHFAEIAEGTDGEFTIDYHRAAKLCCLSEIAMRKAVMTLGWPFLVPVEGKPDTFRFHYVTPGVHKEKPVSRIKATHVYLMRNKRNGLTKIGRSKKPAHRESTLQSEVPEVELIFCSPLTDPRIEDQLHSEFHDKRQRGEWFNLSDTDVEYICRYEYPEVQR